MSMDFAVKVFPLGAYQANCILISDLEVSKTAIAFDVGGNPKNLVHYLSEKHLTLTHIFLTHGHFDHIGGVAELAAAFPGTKVAIEASDLPLYENYPHQCKMFGVAPERNPPHTLKPNMIIKDGEKIPVFGGRGEVTVMATPGHTPGSVTFTVSKVGEAPFLAVTGDTLFHQGVGRSDFPGGSAPTLQKSLDKIVDTLPGSLHFECGHGPGSEIARQGRPRAY